MLSRTTGNPGLSSGVDQLKVNHAMNRAANGSFMSQSRRAGGDGCISQLHYINVHIYPEGRFFFFFLSFFFTVFIFLSLHDLFQRAASRPPTVQQVGCARVGTRARVHRFTNLETEFRFFSAGPLVRGGASRFALFFPSPPPPPPRPVCSSRLGSTSFGKLPKLLCVKWMLRAVLKVR